LSLEGDIGGTIGQINIGSPTVNGIRISNTGIIAYKNSVPTVTISSSGDATFTGVITALEGGSIAGWNISSSSLSTPNDKGVFTVNTDNVELWTGQNASGGAGFPTVNNTAKLGFDNTTIGLYRRGNSSTQLHRMEFSVLQDLGDIRYSGTSGS